MIEENLKNVEEKHRKKLCCFRSEERRGYSDRSEQNKTGIRCLWTHIAAGREFLEKIRYRKLWINMSRCQMTYSGI